METRNTISRNTPGYADSSPRKTEGVKKGSDYPHFGKPGRQVLLCDKIKPAGGKRLLFRLQVHLDLEVDLFFPVVRGKPGIRELRP